MGITDEGESWGSVGAGGFLPCAVLVRERGSILSTFFFVSAARFFFTKRWTRSREEKMTRPAGVCPGLDSEFYLVEQKLIELGLGRRSGEDG